MSSQADQIIRIGDLEIGAHRPPVIVAELSGNHNRSLGRALRLVEAAAEAGAHAVKLQTYTADTMTLDISGPEFTINDPDSLWHGRSLYELYDEAHTPWEWHQEIFDRSGELGLVCFSTPFDSTAVDFLENLNTPCYKIASFENTDLPLIRKVCQTGKPVIISTGMASLEELTKTVQTARQAGCRDLILLKCTSAYPAPPEAANLRTIADLQERFGCQVGLSDHTLGLATALTSVAMGATLIEKHFTLSRDEGGVDAAFSLEPAELKALVEQSQTAWLSLGRVSYDLTDKEQKSQKYRRSLYFVKDMDEGEIISEASLRAIRPGGGLPPGEFERLIGRRVKMGVARGTPVSWDLVE